MGFDYTSLAGQTGFEMPNDWRVMTIGDVAAVNELVIQRDYPHESIEYIDIACVERGTVNSVQELPLRNAPSRAKRIVRDNDTLVSTVRPNLEHYAFVKRAKPNTIASTGFAVVTAKNVDPGFLYYYLTTKPFTAYLGQIADGHTSAYPAFNPELIETAELLVPPPDEQRAIAHILGTLDDKIELNRQMNQTLEAMAQALFKSWFVDFEPYRDQGMQDSPLGQIPVGWRVQKVDQILELKYGKGLKDEDRNTGTVPVYGSNGRVGCHDDSLAKGPGIIVGRKGNPGTVTWAPCDFFPIDTTFYVIPVGPIKSMAYLFYALQHLNLPSLAADSAVPGLNRNIAYMSDMLVPHETILAKFDQWTYQWREKIYATDQESDTLSAIRDTLLPRLLSGEIRVKDPEKFV